MQDLDPTQYGEADAGGPASCGSFVGARETLSLMAEQIICGVIFYESLGKAVIRLRRAAVDSSVAAAIRSNFRLPIASPALGSSSGAPWTILSQGHLC
jgi:hypothetical protein